MKTRAITVLRKSGSSVILTLPKYFVANMNLMNGIQMELVSDEDGKTFTCYPIRQTTKNPEYDDQNENKEVEDQETNSGQFNIQ